MLYSTAGPPRSVSVWFCRVDPVAEAGLRHLADGARALRAAGASPGTASADALATSLVAALTK